jgi:hypothetical protein
MQGQPREISIRNFIDISVWGVRMVVWGRSIDPG